MKRSRFYTRDDFDVRFSKRVQKGWAHYYLGRRRVIVRRIGTPGSDEGWDAIVFSPEDRWVCVETPQHRRAAASKRSAK